MVKALIAGFLTSLALMAGAMFYLFRELARINISDVTATRGG